MIFDLRQLDIEEFDNVDKGLTIYGNPLVLPICIEDNIVQNMIENNVLIGNKEIGCVIFGGGNWNVIENEGQNKVPFTKLIDAIMYILKEEGYL